MSSRTSAVEWVETTEEVVIIEECLPPGSISPAVIPALEPTEAPIQKLLGAAGDGDNPEAGNGFYCEDCLTLFQEQNDPSKINGPSFILDFPTSMGATQRALLTLPYGLMIGRSSIPNVGIGVMNHGPILSPGMHFGPFEGEQTTVENAIASDFSWEIYKGKDEYEYIDAARESFSNWMRYVNCARSKDETNLLAVQYKGSILFHCCRPIHPGDELLVWPSSKLLSNFSEAWTQMWFMKLKAAESVLPGTSQIFLCSHCQLSFTTEAFLQRHTESHHNQPEDSCILLAAQAAEPETPAGSADSSLPSAPLETTDPIVSKTCPDCGKVFKQIPHLKRHKLFVHSNKRPYCCPQCRRSFSQASGLIRHQLVHKKQAAAKMLHHHNQILGEKTSSSTSRLEPPDAPAADEPMETKGTYASESQEAAVDETSAEEVDTSQKLQTNSKNCSECGKSFINEVSLRKHKATVHDKVRPYVCTVCQKGFGQYNDLTRHLSRHLRQQCQGSKSRDGLSESLDEFDVMPFSCAECSLAFSTVDSLQQHISESHSEDAQTEDPEEDPVPKDDPDFVPQPSVAETVESIQNLPLQRPQRHGARSKVSTITKLIAPKRRATACKAASAGTNEAKKRGNELETPGATKSAKCKWFSCNHCKQTYGNPDDLKVHKCALRQHACGHCDATFNKSSSLKKHELAAHPKSHSCERCGKGFSTSGNLKQHRKINTCTKYHCTSELFSCSFCQFSFTMKSYLVKHVRRHHPVEYLSLRESDSLTEQLEEEKAEKDLLCPHCGKRYTSSKAFKTHICFQQVKVLYLCTDCGKGFANHYSLKQHQRVHTGEKPYSCPHCSKSFSYTGQLNVHLRTHTGEKPYLCTHCGESFRQSGDLKRHERKHTGVRPYSCPECCKSFSRPQSLKAHQMLHLGQRMFKCTQCGKSFSRNYHLRRHHQKMHL